MYLPASIHRRSIRTLRTGKYVEKIRNKFLQKLKKKIICSKGIPIEREEDPIDPCLPSPCGPNSRCENHNGFAKCTCLPNYYGRAPSCRPECILNSDCPSNQACMNNKCSNPCTGTCGINAHCDVVNHYPICSCPSHLRGDPLVHCDTKPDCKNLFGILKSNNKPMRLKSLTKSIEDLTFNILTH